MYKIPPLTAEERDDLELWTGVNDEDGNEDEDDYEKRFVEISSETMTRADLQHVGGLLFSEGHDDIYQKLLLRTEDEGYREVVQILKAMKGLHRSPRITTSAQKRRDRHKDDRPANTARPPTPA